MLNPIVIQVMALIMSGVAFICSIGEHERLGKVIYAVMSVVMLIIALLGSVIGCCMQTA